MGEWWDGGVMRWCGGGVARWFGGECVVGVVG